MRLPPSSTLFPYTTLFRSQRGSVAGECDVHGRECLGMATGEVLEHGGAQGTRLLRVPLSGGRRPLECELELFRDLRSGQSTAACPGKRERRGAERALCIWVRECISDEHQLGELFFVCIL